MGRDCQAGRFQAGVNVSQNEDAVVQRLRALGHELPSPAATHFDYLPASRYGQTVFVAGQIPKVTDSSLLAYGVVGKDVEQDLAIRATQLCVLHALAWIRSLAGNLDENVERILRVNFFFQVPEESFGGMSQIADAGSQLLAAVLGPRGRHPRSVIGVRELPRNAPVLIDMDVAVR